MALLPTRSGGRTLTTRTFPLRDVEDVYDRMDKLLSNVFSDLGQVVEDVPWAPQADIAETEDAYILAIDVPGVRKDQIDVQMRDRDVIISGEITRPEREGARWHRRARPVGRFEYRATLPGDINPDKVNAELSDGVLTLTIPKAETAKPRRIEIAG